MQGDRKVLIFGGILIAIFAGTSAHAGFLGPANYNECVSDSMKGVKSDYAAQRIDEACQKRFPGGKKPEPAAPRSLSQAELALLTGRGGAVAQNANFFAGSVYNGNKEGTVKGLTIYLMPKVPAESFHEIVKEMDAMAEQGRRHPRESAPVMLPFDDIARKKKETEGHLRYYHIAIEIPPLSTRSFSVQVLESDVTPEGYDWGVADAEVD